MLVPSAEIRSEVSGKRTVWSACRRGRGPIPARPGCEENGLDRRPYGAEVKAIIPVTHIATPRFWATASKGALFGTAEYHGDCDGLMKLELSVECGDTESPFRRGRLAGTCLSVTTLKALVDQNSLRLHNSHGVHIPCCHVRVRLGCSHSNSTPIGAPLHDPPAPPPRRRSVDIAATTGRTTPWTWDAVSKAKPK